MENFSMDIRSFFTRRKMAKKSEMKSNQPIGSLTQLAREGSVERLRNVLRSNQSMKSDVQRRKVLNQHDESKLSPLHYAARYHHFDMMKFLIAMGADVNNYGEDNITPMHMLAKYKKKEPQEPDPPDTNATEVFQAEDTTEIRLGYIDSDASFIKPEPEDLCLDLLLEKGALVNTRDMSGLTPLHYAASRGNKPVLKELLKAKDIALEAVDNQGMTPLHMACIAGQLDSVSLLVEVGVSLLCKDKEGSTPFHLACHEGCVEIAKFLLSEKIRTRALTAKLNNTKPVQSNGIKKEIEEKPMIQMYKLCWNADFEDDSDNEQEILISSYPSEANVTRKKKRLKKKKYKDIVKDMLHTPDFNRNLPVHLAVENGCFDIVKLCIDASKELGLGSMVNKCRAGEETCLHLAIAAGSLDIVKLVIKEGADVNKKNGTIKSPLYLACKQNAHQIAKELLERGADIEHKTLDLMTPLMIASRFGNLECISLLIENNADVRQTDKDDKNCLMWAAEEDRVDAIKLLLTNKTLQGMIEDRDKFNNTCLHLASKKGHSSTVKLLFDFEASAESKNDNDHTTLHVAAFHGHNNVITELLEQDKSIINNQDEDGNTALHLASSQGKIKCVDILTQAGANIEIRNSKQWSALDCACANGYPKAAASLLESGASVQPKGKVKIAPLHLSCQRGHVEIVRLLLDWHADVTFRAAGGRNGLDYAIDYMQKECVMALLKHPTWRDSMQNFVVDPRTGIVNTPMRKLIRTMEDMAIVVCDQCITNNGKKPEDDNYEATFDYELLDDMYSCSAWTSENKFETFTTDDRLTDEAVTYSDSSDVLKPNHPLKIAVRSSCQNLLLHPLVEGLLNYKWKKYCRYTFYGNFLLFTIFLIMFNCYMLTVPPYYKIDWNLVLENHNSTSSTGFSNKSCVFYLRTGYKDSHRDIPTGCQDFSYLSGLRWAIWVFSVSRLILEFLQLLKARLNYLSMTNVIESLLYLTCALALWNFTEFNLHEFESSHHSDYFIEDRYLNSSTINLQDDIELRQKWQNDLGAFSIFLSWLAFLGFIEKMPNFGIYVVMFSGVIKTFVEFFFIFIFVLLAFAFSFVIIFGNQPAFFTWWESLLSCVDMMVGELNYHTRFYDNGSYATVVFPNQGISLMLFTLFIVLLTIIVMNLLVGLAVGDIMEIKENAIIRKLGMHVDLILEVEFNVPLFLRKKLFMRRHRMLLNKYRKANVLVKFLFDDPGLKEKLRSLADDDDDEVEQDDVGSLQDKIMSNLNHLKGRVTDLLNDATEVKQGVSNVRGLVRDSRKENKTYTEDLKTKLTMTGTNLTENISNTHYGLSVKTLEEAESTRQQVMNTLNKVDDLTTDVHNVRLFIDTVNINLLATINTNTDNMLRFMEMISGKVDQVITSQSLLKTDVENVRLLVADVQTESLQYHQQSGQHLDEQITNVLNSESNTQTSLFEVNKLVTTVRAEADENKKNLSRELDENMQLVRSNQDKLAQDVEGVRNQLSKAETDATTNLETLKEHICTNTQEISAECQIIKSNIDCVHDRVKMVESKVKDNSETHQVHLKSACDDLSNKFGSSETEMELRLTAKIHESNSHMDSMRRYIDEKLQQTPEVVPPPSPAPSTSSSEGGSSDKLPKAKVDKINSAILRCQALVDDRTRKILTEVKALKPIKPGAKQDWR